MERSIPYIFHFLLCYKSVLSVKDERPLRDKILEEDEFFMQNMDKDS
ncbi:hypothetical protein T479_13005 [Lysinibacillus varians]|nr:hypothetical protein T479_13005 [Lysinibacillus varians]